MIDRGELLESVLESLTEGVALADREGCVVLWNRTAERITGHSRGEMLGHRIRERLDALVLGGAKQWIRQTESGTALTRGFMVRVRHKLGCPIPVMVRIRPLHDSLGGAFGMVALFHNLENIDALPDGELTEDVHFAESQAELGDRLAALREDSLGSDVPFGVIWVSIDQASELRRTHGRRAAEAMLEAAERRLSHGLRPSDEFGRWSEDDFLVLAFDRNAALLDAHAKLLAGYARTTDFRWWGDRISVTASVGTAQAEPSEMVGSLLGRAQAAMAESVRAGGNRVTKARGSS